METVNTSLLRQQAENTVLEPFVDELLAISEALWATKKHGDIPKWQHVVHSLPAISTQTGSIDCSRVGQSDVQVNDSDALADLLKGLHPWRKGPYELAGIHIDTEWRSDWKWDRVAPHISDLHGRVVLDIGCGNGYHCWRMSAAGAKMVLGIEPMQLFHYQFATVRHFVGEQHPVHLLPMGVEHLPGNMCVFDSVFSMGVLYHRRSPLDHILELKSLLRPGGELLLETLVIPGDDFQTLVPEDRYAQMRNVWFIPTVKLLKRWLRRCGFKNVQLVDINQTSIEEQRSTAWMTFESLENWLDADNHNLTLEGYPAPLRATIVMQK